jgi:LacI family transcriptional regulator
MQDVRPDFDKQSMEKQQQPMNINEIAKRAGVSTATVSRTINGSGKVSPKTAEKVMRVVDAMGYHPSSYARTLASGRSRLLGLIISDIVNPFFPELVRSFEEFALGSGLEVIVANTGYDPERMSHSARRMIERKAEGVAVMTSEMQQNFIAQLETRRIPMVFLDTGRVGLRTSNIRVDYEKGIDEAMAHLVGLGHERIGFISGPLEYASAIARRDAFLKYLQQYGLVKDEDLLQVGDFMLGGGEVAMGRMLSLKKPPTAVLASNDLSAIGAMRTALHLGLRVPEDISIIGFDDIDFCQLTRPDLTTIRISRRSLAEKAFNALTTIMDETNRQGRQYDVETSLIIRGSTGTCR